MKAFQYATARTPETARELLGKRGEYLAGGNDLLGLIKEAIEEPDVLVNIKALPDLHKIQPGEASWVLGANVTIAQIEDHPEVAKVFPALHQAAADVGSLQIRNVATLGGNLAQHSRCWYFRHRDVMCLKKGGYTCFAREGENRFHSLFTGNQCISPVVSNMSVALAALGAMIVVQRGPNLLRWSVADFYSKAWNTPTEHNSLEDGDLILRVEVPHRNHRNAYRQISQKEVFDWALASCAVSARLDGNRLKEPRVVLGVVAPVPYEVPAVNDFMEGKVLDETLAASVADRMLKDPLVLQHNGYKVPLARALVQRTLLSLRS